MGRIKSKDLNGLIRSFDVLPIDSNSAGSSSSNNYNKNKYIVYGTNYGIKIKIKVMESLNFTLCLKDVFEPEFSNNVIFKRSKKYVQCDASLPSEPKPNCKAQCSNQVGLPCLDLDKFQSDYYDSSGYNKHKIGGKTKKKSAKNDRAMVQGEVTDDDSWGVLSGLDPNTRWSLISIFAVFGLLIVGFAGYVFMKQRHKKQDLKDKMNRNVVELEEVENDEDEVYEMNDDALDKNNNLEVPQIQHMGNKYGKTQSFSKSNEMPECDDINVTVIDGEGNDAEITMELPSKPQLKPEWKDKDEIAVESPSKPSLKPDWHSTKL